MNITNSSGHFFVYKVEFLLNIFYDKHMITLREKK